MDTDSEMVENIKACRTCGIHYVTPSKNQLKHLFQSSIDNSEIMLIRLELSQWNVEVAENDGFPQYVCNACIHKFEQVFALRTACINAQNEFRKFYAVPNGNIHSVKIKTEMPDAGEEPPMCDFIYVDDLSDTEYDGATPFNFLHIPIKAEVIEAAAIPMEESEQPTNILESASGAVVQTGPSSSHIPDCMSQNESLAASQPVAVLQEAVEDIECKLCHHLSSNEEEHKQHLQRAHEIGDFECHICGKEFKNSTPARLKFHIKWHSLNRRVRCTICGFVCNSKDALKEHKRANHNKLACKICGKGVLAKRMKSHIRQHELILKYSCEYCTKAFATEDERENHIWQIHANEDDCATPNSITPFQTTCTQTTSESPFVSQEMCQKTEDAIIYKFMCAHCELRFIEQIDLEKHVKEEHRVKCHLLPVGPQTVAFVEEGRINETAEMAQNEQDFNEQANITVFEEYDENDQIHATGNNDSSINNIPILSQNFSLPSSSSVLVNQAENLQSDETETASSVSYEESDAGESEDEANSNLSSYPGSSLNTFACAKCSATFVTVEQLRQHHEQHLAADQQQQLKTSPMKSKFKCNLCGKFFDLKFSLNRHVKKHKHAPL